MDYQTKPERLAHSAGFKSGLRFAALILLSTALFFYVVKLAS